MAFRKRLHASLEQLQADLDAWLVTYNEQRTHQGKMCCGRTPWETFEDGRRLVLKDFMASANIPAASGTVQSGIIAKLGAESAMNAVCPIWEGLRLIRDEVTNADKGQIQVTAVALHNFKVLRPDGFVRTKVKLA